MPITVPIQEIKEQTTGKYSGQITDLDGSTALALASISTIVLSLYVIDKEGVTRYINSRQAQDVKNLNNVTISAGGALVWSIQTADSRMYDLSLPFEDHHVLFEWTDTSGNRGKRRRILRVRNLTAVL